MSTQPEDAVDGELSDLVHCFRRTLQDLSHQGYLEAPNRPTHREGGAIVSLSVVREKLGDCQACGLAQGRTKLVFGNGSETAPLMFIGEAPGANEDREGLPFVGKAGALLDKMILAMGRTRDSVYVTNIVKCRPPNNRDPQPEEVGSCKWVLQEQIAAVAPQAIVTLGRPAAHAVLETSVPMGKLRGTWQTYQGIPVMPTYHPAYLLRNPAKKRDTWADLQAVMAELGSAS